MMLDTRPVPSDGVDASSSSVAGAAGAAGAVEPGAVVAPAPAPVPYRFSADTARGASGGLGWSSNCPESMNVYEAAGATGTALRIVGWYAPAVLREQSYPPIGEGVVNLFRVGRSVLVLSAYETTHWTVHVGAGASIEAIYVSGFNRHTVAAPPGVAVNNYSGNGNELPQYAFDWPSESDELGAAELVSVMEMRTGLRLTSFHGCYEMSQTTLFDEAAPGAACGGEALVGGGCSGNILALGSLGAPFTGDAPRPCNEALIGGAGCCAQLGELGQWFLTDGEPTSEGGVPAGRSRSAWSCAGAGSAER